MSKRLTWEDNILDLPDLKAHLFRYFPAKYLRRVFNDRRLTLVKPAQWDDPFENVLLQCRLRLPDGEHASLEPLRQCLYGQCWTLLPESDAMWRIYSPGRDAIRVETTVGRLFKAFYRESDRYARLSFFIGRVEYLSELELVHWLTRRGGAQLLIQDPSGRGLAESLLKKRDAFSHEKEVRLIYHHPHPELAARKPIYQVPVAPDDLFRSMSLDPRLDDREASRQELSIRKWGYSGLIKKSELYESRTFVIKMKDLKAGT